MAALVASVLVPSLAAAGERAGSDCAGAGISGVGEPQLPALADPPDAGDPTKRPTNVLPILGSAHAWTPAVLSHACRASESLKHKPNADRRGRGEGRNDEEPLFPLPSPFSPLRFLPPQITPRGIMRL